MPSTTVLICLWGPRACGAGSSWRPTLPRSERAGLASPERRVVYELFLTNLPQGAFTAADIVALSLHRGAFENARASEDQEQDPDRWWSHAACGQECWQIVSQWVWNLRLELGHQLHPDPVRTTEVAPAHLCELEEEASSPSPSQGYGPAEVALRRTRWPLLGTRLCSPAGWHAALWEQGSRLWRTSGALKPTGACAWSLRPASAAVAPVLCGSSVNGMVPPPPSLVG